MFTYLFLFSEVNVFGMDPKFNSMEQALGLTTLEVDSLIEYSTVLVSFASFYQVFLTCLTKCFRLTE